MKYSIAIWVVLVSIVIAWLITEHRKMSVLLDSCHRQQQRTQADIDALAQHRMELDTWKHGFERSLNLAVGGD